jgi:hypothetical protein
VTQEISADSAKMADAAVRGTRFDSQDIGVFLHEAISEFVNDLGAPGRGISWAITLLREEGSTTLAAGSPASESVDQLQAAFEDGPSRAAARAGEFVLITDMRRERRWPGYAAGAVNLGILSALSVPLSPADVFRTAFNMYAPLPHLFTSTDITAAVRFARRASWTLRLVEQAGRQAKNEEELSSAQLSRVLAAMALRTLVREYGFSVEEALEYLRRAAGNLPQPEGQAVPLSTWEFRPATLDPRGSTAVPPARGSKPRTPGRARPAPERSA